MHVFGKCQMRPSLLTRGCKSDNNTSEGVEDSIGSCWAAELRKPSCEIRYEAWRCIKTSPPQQTHQRIDELAFLMRDGWNLLIHIRNDDDYDSVNI
jgi:hypothetical protein